mmetsp:Transcript_24374/g.58840  ORF Transcript_24374/g.58840 Transcript_24374/m.58840 type:complete len:96 (-) Transcript_24374:68-355(-)|eukprot:CAMPEP_0181107922 /NCGR_PEP_ID=MMETSP1071-20121207/17345_1 /TAXON_ID=35127 /ORGANISM="Thalassiosira sp., Strain NH16" /LENGTH=95 /DNA_ID=CAMNT_0023191471 /DNA_START=219 /DNA_END=506 /DNA_ORIENTATION=+
MISRLEWFQRAVGLKGGRFRQTGFSGGNIIVGTVLGVLSGKYIFEEPLQHYWAEKRAEELAAGGTASSSSTASNTPLPASGMGNNNGTSTSDTKT